MGFNKVYRSLQEVFPQIDARVLKAVAIEHSKDADTAVEVVLSEIIPFFTEKSRTNSMGGACSTGLLVNSSMSSGGYIMNGRAQPYVFDADEGRSTPSNPLPESKTAMESSEASIGAENVVSPSVNSGISNEVRASDATNGGGRVHVFDADDGHVVESHEGVYTSAELAVSKNSHEASIEKNIAVDSLGEAASYKVHENVLQIDGSSDLGNGTVSAGKYPESNIETSLGNVSSQTLRDQQDTHYGNGLIANLFRGMLEDDKVDVSSQTSGDQQDRHDGNGLIANFFRGMLEDDKVETKFGTNSDQVVNNPVVAPASLSVHSRAIPGESGLQLVDSSLSNGTNSLIETGGDDNVTEDAALNTSMSNSNQMYMLEVLEEVIADARNNKKTMFSTMQSVISLMKEVELKERSAEQAKMEADMGSTDILVEVEELKETIHRAKEANSMHAGEVYGEKSVLTSELRELQSRVLSLSDERDNSLAVLDEMRNTLEVRLAEAETEIKSAEQRKLEKEMVAKAALAEQELIMEKVVQESKILKQQAEDNAKLQEFLMDRGRIVDKLQGEIAVICQDVRLLKEKFDQGVPFSKSLSSSHTSFILASSSNSSSNSLVPKQMESVFDGTCDLLEAQNKEDPIGFFDKQSYEEKVTKDGHSTLVDDGWELCDD